MYSKSRTTDLNESYSTLVNTNNIQIRHVRTGYGKVICDILQITCIMPYVIIARCVLHITCVRRMFLIQKQLWIGKARIYYLFQQRLSLGRDI